MALLISKLMYKLHSNSKLVFLIFTIILLSLGFTLPYIKINYSISNLIHPENQTSISFKKIQQEFNASSLILLKIDSLEDLPNSKIDSLIQEMNHIPSIKSTIYPSQVIQSSPYQFLFLDTLQLLEKLDEIENIKIAINNPLLLNEKPISNSIKNPYENYIFIISSLEEFDYSNNLTLKSNINNILQNHNINKYKLSGNNIKNIQNIQNILYTLLIISVISILVILIYLLSINSFKLITPIYIIVLNFISISFSIAILSYFKIQIHYLHLFILPILFTILIFSSIKLFRRFHLEISKGLSPKIALETILLESGPTLVRSYFIMMISFLSLATFNFYCIQELAYICSLSTFTSGLLTLGTLPWFLAQTKKRPLSNQLPRLILDYKRTKSKAYAQTFILLMITICLLSLFSPHQYISRQFNLSESQSDNYIFISSNHADSIVKVISNLQQKNLIQSYFVSNDLIPSSQLRKINIIHEILDSIKTLPTEYIPNSLLKLKSTPLNDTISPLTFNKILPLHNRHFAYIIPKFTTHSIDEVRDIVRPVYNMNPTTTYYYGDLFIIYEYISSIISNINIWIIYFLLFIFTILLFEIKNLVHTLVIMSPMFLAFIVFILFLDFIQAPIQLYFVFLIPIFAFLAIDSALYIFHRYIEEGRGSLKFILKRTRPDILLCHTSLILVFSCFYLSHLQVLQNFATMGICASISIVLCTFILLPFFLSMIDKKRWQEYHQGQRKKSLYLQN